MKKPLRTEFGYSKKTGWQDERDRDLYDAALLAYYNRPVQVGRPATNPIHESWNEISKLFDSSSFYRSRRAFCRWANIHYATFSAMQRRQLTDDVERFILEWEATWNKEVETPKISPMERGQIIYSQYLESGYAVPGLKKKKGVKSE